ncbi:putative oxidoreductase EphD [Colletotrichum tropicale]|nr:putative oxidoreductase EphD [Colletotrichum tropicale]
MDYQDKIIVVTGGAHGLGRAVAVEFAKAGAKVVLADIQQAPQLAAVETLREAGLKAWAFQCDVGNDESVSSFAAAVQKEIGVPDIIYNNAVLIRSGGIIDLDMASLQQQVNVNVFGYIRMVQAFLPAMTARGTGWIVNTASPNGNMPIPPVASNLFSYCLCKAADISMSQCMAVTLKPLGISMSVVFPDITFTETVDSLSGTASDEFHQTFTSFLKQQGKNVDVVGKKIIDTLRGGEFFVNVCPGYEDAVVELAKNKLDPMMDYFAKVQRKDKS